MNAQDHWFAAYSQLELQMERATFNTWLRGAVYLDYDEAGNHFVIGVDNAVARDTLQHRLYRRIRAIVCEALNADVDVQFVVHRAEPALPADDDMPLFRMLADQPDVVSEPLHRHVARPKLPDLLEGSLTPKFTFERFIVSDTSPLAYPAAQAVVERPGTAYNPLLIYGGVGLGKTHLLHAIGHALRARGLRVVYISSEAFTNDLVDSIRHKTQAMFRERYRSADVLLMDDVQFLGGKESTQDEVFHTFNALHMHNKQIVLAADRHPTEMENLVDRLRSRFVSGLSIKVELPDYETRIAIVQMWASERGVIVPLAVAEMLAARVRTHIRDLESAFNQVVASSQMNGYALSTALVDNVLTNARKPRHVTVSQVIHATAQHFRLTADELTSPSRAGAINHARQVGMYLARELTFASLQQIGDSFGRKHSTVLHSIRQVAEAAETGDEALSASIEAIKALIS